MNELISNWKREKITKEEKEKFELFKFKNEKYDFDEYFYYDSEKELLYYVDGTPLKDNGIEPDTIIYIMTCKKESWKENKKVCTDILLDMTIRNVKMTIHEEKETL